MAVRRRARGRSRLAWAGLTVVPWALAGGMLVSMAAEAGQEPAPASSRLGLTDPAAAMPGDLVPLADAAEGRGFALPPSGLLAADEAEPRIVMKGEGRAAPADRGRRGDPAVPVRPTFAARLGTPGALEHLRAAAVTFGEAEDAGDGFAPVPVDAPWADPSRLQPLPPDLVVTTKRARSASSPQAEAGSTTPEAEDGATPAVARAVSLASTTPEPADAAPIAVAALPKFSRGPHGLITDDRTVVGVAQAHPDYAATIETAKSAPEQRCLAQAVYFEARSEPEEGQAAVAQVVLNRAMSGLYPGSVCGVVFQNQQRRNACQFSFTCEGHGLRVSEGESWDRAVRIAREVTEGTTYVQDVGSATHYHATYVRPGWARALKRTEAIGHHVFYTLRPGQT